MFAARDYIMNVDARDLTAVRDKLLQVPNMNTTGRLPAVLLLHMKIQVRVTVSDERLAAHAPVDTTGIVLDGCSRSPTPFSSYTMPLRPTHKLTRTRRTQVSDLASIWQTSCALEHVL